MKKPRLVLNTDDDMSMNSELHITVHKALNRIDLIHKKQYGGEELIQIFPGQIDSLVKFLQQSKIWIESGYKDKLAPESFKDI